MLLFQMAALVFIDYGLHLVRDVYLLHLHAGILFIDLLFAASKHIRFLYANVVRGSVLLYIIFVSCVMCARC